jgi:hypothetical protein
MSGFDLDELVAPCDERRFVDPSRLPREEWPAWTEADEAAFVADLIARDPALAVETSPADVVATVESAPVDAGTLRRLVGVDPAELDDTGLVGFATAWTWVANHAAAQVARAVAMFHARIDRGELLTPSALASAEFSAALGLGSGAADRLVSTAVALARRLPATMSALDRGELSWPKAAVLAERTARLSAEQAARVEAAVLPEAVARTPARHADAVRRAVDRIDPAGSAERRRRAQQDIALIRAHIGDGMGELFARMPSEQLDTVWTGADAWARRAKAGGDARTLDQLRVAALVRWASSFLVHGDESVCDTSCDPSSGAVQSEAAARPPTRHGRPVTVRAIWDLESFLGLADRPGELADSGAVLGAETLRTMLAGGVRLRRLLVDPATGELLDLTPDYCSLPATDGSPHHSPVEIHVVVPVDRWEALRAGSDPALSAAVAGVAPSIRAMLTAPATAEVLDEAPDAYPAPAALADFIATRDRHPTSPAAGPTAARASDLDHVVAVRDGGTTIRDNLTTPTRRWHRLRTLGGWTVRRVGRGWLWTSPTGRTTRTAPYDYRLGP